MRLSFAWHKDYDEPIFVLDDLNGKKFTIGLSKYAPDPFGQLLDFYGDVKYSTSGYALLNLDDEGANNVLLVQPNSDWDALRLTVDIQGNTEEQSQKAIEVPISRKEFVEQYEQAFEEFLASDLKDLDQEYLQVDKFREIKSIADQFPDEK